MNKKAIIRVIGLVPCVASAGVIEVVSQDDWEGGMGKSEGIVWEGGVGTPSGESAFYRSGVKKFSEKKKVRSMVVEQSPEWLNWKKVENVGPRNAKDAPVFLSVGDKDYWLFARYGGGAVDQTAVAILRIEEKVYMRKMSREEADKKIADLRKQKPAEGKGGGFAAKDPFQTNGSGGEELGLGGYHGWHSKDMKNWVHHGPVSNGTDLSGFSCSPSMRDFSKG
ncbi:hypothetical protein ACFSW8_15390, partial [Rubritalea tangerina]